MLKGLMTIDKGYETEELIITVVLLLELPFF